MIKKLFLLTLFASLCVTPALAARTMEKSYKITVTMPASVEMAGHKTDEEVRAAPKAGWWQTTEKMVTAGRGQMVLLRTTVVQ